jgi:hypothetical protein
VNGKEVTASMINYLNTIYLKSYLIINFTFR